MKAYSAIGQIVIIFNFVASTTSAFCPNYDLNRYHQNIFGGGRLARPATTPVRVISTGSQRNMIEITEGVEYDTIAREWRCKWCPDGDKASLVAAQVALETVIDDLKEVDGVKRVDRVVCGECLDFKVVTSLHADKFEKWGKSKFAPEPDFVEMLKAIEGISFIETQTYTLMEI